MKQCRDQRCKKAIPPEEDDEDNKTTLAPDVGHARDAYSFGVLVQELLEHIGNLGKNYSGFSHLEGNFKRCKVSLKINHNCNI